jgi:hypothetical protein
MDLVWIRFGAGIEFGSLVSLYFFGFGFGFGFGFSLGLFTCNRYLFSFIYLLLADA